MDDQSPDLESLGQACLTAPVWLVSLLELLSLLQSRGDTPKPYSRGYVQLNGYTRSSSLLSSQLLVFFGSTKRGELWPGVPCLAEIDFAFHSNTYPPASAGKTKRLIEFLRPGAIKSPC